MTVPRSCVCCSRGVISDRFDRRLHHARRGRGAAALVVAALAALVAHRAPAFWELVVIVAVYGVGTRSSRPASRRSCQRSSIPTISRVANSLDQFVRPIAFGLTALLSVGALVVARRPLAARSPWTPLSFLALGEHGSWTAASVGDAQHGHGSTHRTPSPTASVRAPQRMALGNARCRPPSPISPSSGATKSLLPYIVKRRWTGPRHLGLVSQQEASAPSQQRPFMGSQDSRSGT